jgi:alcohol dehydrogenase class IV
MTRPVLLTPEELAKTEIGKALVWGSPRWAQNVAQHLGVELATALSAIPEDMQTLVVVGGGTRIDQAKVWRNRERPELRLVVIPSLWGSGAEASPVAVLDHDGAKEILVGEAYLPDIRCVMPSLAESIPDDLACYACGDSWSHALEGFLSPLASQDLRSDLGQVILAMLGLPLGKHPDWFDLSARACAGQARSSVGLVHGIAHTIEAPLRRAYPETGWGHARLCACFLYPVMCFNRQASNKLDTLMAEYGLETDVVLAHVRDLYDDLDYTSALPVLEGLWKQVLRDQCSRTNSALVRAQSVSYFVDRAFQT